MKKNTTPSSGEKPEHPCFHTVKEKPDHAVIVVRDDDRVVW